MKLYYYAKIKFTLREHTNRFHSKKVISHFKNSREDIFSCLRKENKFSEYFSWERPVKPKNLLSSSQLDFAIDLIVARKREEEHKRTGIN
ncbi:hypothetical protein ACTXT7_002918 [Hymenolepis weldensis]